MTLLAGSGLPRSVNIKYAVTPSGLARAMAIEARDTLTHLDADIERFGTEDPGLAEYVNDMSKTAALRAFRMCVRAYGELCWPDDYPHEAYLAGLAKAKVWSAR